MERFSGVFLVAGLAFFFFAFVVMSVVPYLHFVDLPVLKADALVEPVMEDFADLARRQPESFARAFPTGVNAENATAALREGRDLFIGEGCWHCHSQFIRPVSNEDLRWGKISAPAEYHNELQMPPLLGTRRVGPDLIREAGVRSNDWHIAHFFNPRFVSPTSVMPPFPWFFEIPDQQSGETSAPVPVLNRKGFAIVTYVQWLGSWIPEEERLD